MLERISDLLQRPLGSADLGKLAEIRFGFVKTAWKVFPHDSDEENRNLLLEQLWDDYEIRFVQAEIIQRAKNEEAIEKAIDIAIRDRFFTRQTNFLI